MEKNNSGNIEMLKDDDLKDVSGGLNASSKEKVDKALDVLDKVLDCAEPNSPVGKASVSGAKTVIKAIRNK